MSSTYLLRVAARSQSTNYFRPNVMRRVSPVSRLAVVLPTTTFACNSFSTSTRKPSEEGNEESFEEFTARYVSIFSMLCILQLDFRLRLLDTNRFQTQI